jgi:class 3 adenylate cyclase
VGVTGLSSVLEDGTSTVLVGATWPGEGIAIGDTPGGRAFAFRSAAGAVRAAVTLQGERPVAIGLHAGEVRAGEGTATRPAVLAAGLATLARPGQVLVVLRTIATSSRSPAERAPTRARPEP